MSEIDNINFDIIIIDEVQDMNVLYYLFVLEILKLNKKNKKDFKLMIIGDNR